MFVVANWKLNNSLSDAVTWFETFFHDFTPETATTVTIVPSFTELHFGATQLAQHNIDGVSLGAQDVSRFSEGKHTGEVGAFQLKELGVATVILGHSERRSEQNETTEVIIDKLLQCEAYDLQPIVAVSNIDQVSSLSTDYDGNLDQIVWAYEPLESIGSAHPADPESVVAFYESMVKMIGKEIEFIYGGSVDATSVSSYLEVACIKGFLVGTASVKAEDFLQLLNVIQNYGT